MLGPRVVIPEGVRREVLDNHLLMHQGATKLRQRARLTMFWPSMDNDIVTAARTCRTCTEYLPSHQPEPLLPHARSSRPFEFIHADLGCHNGRDFLIFADHFSGWPHVVPFPDKNTTARKIVGAIRSFFSFDAGAPVKFWSDGDPQFTSDGFNKLMRDWSISHGVSSAGYSQSNGFAEVSVKNMKKLIRGFSKVLLLYRNAPWYLTVQSEIASQLIDGHSLRSGKNRPLRWKKRPCAPARFVRPISTRLRTPCRRWRLATRS